VRFKGIPEGVLKPLKIKAYMSLRGAKQRSNLVFLFYLFFLSKNPIIPNKIMAVDKKQAPTPMNIVTPKLLNPRQMENTREPKANIGRADPMVTVYNFNKSH